jgi:Zn-dependent metalloprotease
MRIAFASVALLAAISTPSASRGAFIEPEARALAALRAASSIPVEASFEAGFPRSLRFNVAGPAGATPGQVAAEFLEQRRDLFSQDHAELALIPVATEQGEANVVAFGQTFRGIPVFGARIGIGVWNVAGAPPRILQSAGWLLPATPALDELDTVPGITPAMAEAAALTAVGSGQVIGETALVIFSRAALGESDPAGPVLAWRVGVGGGVPQQLLVDAHSAEIAFRHSLASDGAGLSDYDADFEDANGGTMASTNCFNPTTIDDDMGSEDGLIPEYINDPEAGAIWWHTRNTYLDFHDLLGRHSWDDDHGEIRAYVHIGLDSNGNPNASYNSGCDEMEFHDRYVGLDVVAHEFTHAVIRHSLSDLVYQGQSGALNEAFADSLAALVVDTDDWLLAEGLLNGQGPIRSMSDPLNGQCDSPNGPVGMQACNDPDRWSLRLSFTTSSDNGNVHSNSGIQNKATFLMAQGGFFNGHSIAGMGKAKTRRLLYFLTRFLQPSTATFADARNWAVSGAQAFVQNGFYGFTAADVCSVRNAYAAVEIGNPDQDCNGVEEAADADADGVLDLLDNCLGLSNPSQTDADDDGVGDACDNDGDNDGIPNGYDNCPSLATDYYGNADTDADGLGRACDPDDDGDGVPENGGPGPCASGQTVGCDDNCPEDPNPTQFDGNNNGEGDACDPDHDGDGDYGLDDNCTFVPNPDQADADGDGYGDACDDCPEDVDSIQAYTTGFPELGIPPEPYQPDSDGDGIPDVCDELDFGSIGLAMGGQSWDESLSPKPDGTRRIVDLVGNPNDSARIPLEICDPLGDPDGPAASEYVELAFENLHPSVQGRIVDDSGRTYGRVSPAPVGPTGPNRGLRFKRRCDRRWFLQLELGPDFPGTESFVLLPRVVAGGGGTPNPWSSLPEALLPPPDAPADLDLDGVPDSVDVCPVAFDPSQENGDGDATGDLCDNCPYYSHASQTDSDRDGRGNPCECTDQNGDGQNTVSDLVEINGAIFDPRRATPLCDGNGDGRCDVSDIVAANVEIYSPGNTSICARQPVPGPGR